jgi:glycosyltransferase involved in cell wall biosynthesis
VGGNREVLGPELAGRLVPSENADALAASWHHALLDDEARARDGEKARQRVIDEFNVRNMVREYEAVYAER